MGAFAAGEKAAQQARIDALLAIAAQQIGRENLRKSSLARARALRGKSRTLLSGPTENLNGNLLGLTNALGDEDGGA